MKYEITKEQILQLNGCIKKESVDYLLEKWFPEAFKTDLEVGKWYKNIYGCLFCFSGDYNEQKDPLGYGFLSEFFLNKWSDAKRAWSQKGLSEATEEEILEALKNEAVKRYRKGDIIKCPFWEDKNYIGTIEGDIYWASGCLCPDVRCNKTNRPNKNFSLFYEGKWAEIIPTITIQEAEKLLNKKII